MSSQRSEKVCRIVLAKADILNYLRHTKPMLLKNYSIEKIGLFGSFVNGEQKPTSDIDIVFHLKKGASLKYKQYIDIEELFKRR